MTTGHANIHVKAGDKVAARFVVEPVARDPYVVIDWYDAPGCALFLPADVDTLDQHIDELMKVRVEVGRAAFDAEMATGQPVTIGTGQTVVRRVP